MAMLGAHERAAGPGAVVLFLHVQNMLCLAMDAFWGDFALLGLCGLPQWAYSCSAQACGWIG